MKNITLGLGILTIVEIIEILFPGMEFTDAYPKWESLSYSEKEKKLNSKKFQLREACDEKFAERGRLFFERNTIY